MCPACMRSRTHHYLRKHAGHVFASVYPGCIHNKTKGVFQNEQNIILNAFAKIHRSEGYNKIIGQEKR